MSYKKNIMSSILLFSFVFCFNIFPDFINERVVNTVQLNLCMVPMPGVKIPCDSPIDAEGNVSTTDLRCFNDDPQNPYCIKCVEIVGKKPKTCQILDINNKPIS